MKYKVIRKFSDYVKNAALVVAMSYGACIMVVQVTVLHILDKIGQYAKNKRGK